MTKDDIIRMANEANLPACHLTHPKALERFAKIVAEHEREACHALRQTLPNPYDHCQVSAHAYDMAISAYGAAIRARGQA